MERNSRMKRLIILLWLGCITILIVGCGTRKWPSNDLGALLPEPTGDYRILSNREHYFFAKVRKVNLENISEYFDRCSSAGFSIDPVQKSNVYEVYNKDGTKLSITYTSDSMEIRMETQTLYGTLNWPNDSLGRLIPQPNSTIGETEKNAWHDFSIIVGNTSKESFNDYVEQCISAGFNVNPERTDSSYSAYNTTGYQLLLHDLSNRSMSIYIDEPKETNSSSEEPIEMTADEEHLVDEDLSEIEVEESIDVIRPEIKEAIDSYEKFLNEYCEFVKTMDSNDPESTARYFELNMEASERKGEFVALLDEKMTEAEKDYHAEVNMRCIWKELEIIQYLTQDDEYEDN